MKTSYLLGLFYMIVNGLCLLIDAQTFVQHGLSPLIGIAAVFSLIGFGCGVAMVFRDDA